MRADFSAFLMLLLGWSQTIDSMALEKFKMIKQCLISAERSRAFGSSLKLTGYEILANKCLMAAKLRELNSGWYFCARNFFCWITEKVFQMRCKRERLSDWYLFVCQIITAKIIRNKSRQKNTKTKEAEKIFFVIESRKNQWDLVREWIKPCVAVFALINYDPSNY